MRCDVSDEEYKLHDPKAKNKKDAFIILKDVTRNFSLSYKQVYKKKELSELPLKNFSKSEI